MTFTLVVLLSFAAYILIGVLAGRRVRTQSDYYLAGRKAPTLLVAGSLVASLISTVGFMGDVGFAYDGYPILLLIVQIIAYVGYIAGAFLFGRYLRRARVLTVPEFFGRRFDSSACQAVAGITVILGIGVYLLAVTQGASLLLSNIMDIDLNAALLIVWACYTFFTVFSGSPGVLLTDTVMFLVFTTAGMLGMVWIVLEAGGPTEVVSRLSNLEAKPAVLDVHGLTGPNAYMGSPAEALTWAVVLGVVWAIVVSVSPWQSSRYMMARSEHVAIRAGALSVGALLLLYVPLAFGAVSINVFRTDVAPSETAFIWAAETILPVWLGALVVAGIAAAGLSTASTFLSLIGFSVAHDVAPTVRRQLRSGAPRTEPSGSGLGFVRASMFAVSVVILIIAYLAPAAVFEIGYFAATLFAASWGPIAILSVRSKRVAGRGAIAGMIVGFGTVAGLESAETFGNLNLPIYLHPAIVGFALSLLSVVVGSVGQARRAESGAFLQSIRQPPAEETAAGELKITSRYLVGLALVSGLLVALLSVVYLVPLQAHS